MLSLIIEKHAPLRQRRVSDRYCPWITSELKTTMRSRDKVKNSAVKHGSALLMQAYRHIRNRVNSLRWNPTFRGEFCYLQLNWNVLCIIGNYS